MNRTCKSLAISYVRAVLAVVLTAFLLAPAHAQRTEGSIAGTVTDPGGAVVTGAAVTVTSQETGQKIDIITNDIGYFRAPYLRPGKYDVRVEAKGFSPLVTKDVEVAVNVVTRADAKLVVGSLTEAVEVSAATPLIQTEEARLADTIGTRQVVELPLNGREIYQLINLQPGVTAAQAPTISNVPSPNSPGTFDFTFVSNGATPRGNNFSLDGTTNNNEWLGGTPLIYPSVDSIEEFQVQTLNFSAEYGRNNGAVTNIITKSGTNQLHGSIFWFHRNTALNARNFFDRVDSDGDGTFDKTPLQQHQFGAAVGGPIRKDSTFFFGSYEGSRRKDGAPERALGETPEFRQLVAAIRPASIANQFFADFPSPACVAGTSFDGGSIPAPGLFQEFTIGPPDGIPDYCDIIATQVQTHRVDQYMVKVDHRFSGNDKLFARWISSYAPTDVTRQQLLNANMRGFRSPLNGFYSDLAAGYTHFFSNSFLNDFRFAFSRNNTDISFEVPPGTTTANQLDAAGIPNIFAHLSLSDGVIPFGGVIFIPRNFIFNTFTFADTMSRTAGKHNLKFGFEFRHIREESNYQFETMPFYLFNSIFNFANDQPWLAEGLTNRDPSSPNFGQLTSTPRNFRWNQWAFFFQDDWKLRSNLTLNLGLRYEVFGIPYEKDGILANLVLGDTGDFFQRIADARAARVDELAATDYNNFAPRIGIAWDPTGKGKMSVRSGFSIAYLEPYSNLYTNVSRFLPPDAAWVDSFPFFGVGTDVNYVFPFQPSPDFAAPSTPNGAVQGSGLFPPGLNPNLRAAYSMQWFLGVQRELGSNFALSVNYVGTKGVKLYVREDWNRFNGDVCNATTCDFTEDRLAPGFFQLFYVDNGTHSNYHGMNVQFRKNYSRGFMFTANYTWGKTLDLVSGPGLGDFFNVSNDRYTGTQDITNRAADYGPSDFNVKHRFTFSGIWDLPSYKGDSAFLKKLLGGWQANSIIALQSGRPFSIYCSLAWFDGCDFNMDGTEFDRPDMPAGIQTSGWSNQQLDSGIFSVSDFCPGGLVPFFLGPPCVPVGENGNMSRNAFNGPGFASVDLSIFKNTAITERVNLQFRAEMFNLFNRSNLFLPSGDMADPNFGRASSAFASRQIQFGLKVLF